MANNSARYAKLVKNDDVANGRVLEFSQGLKSGGLDGGGSRAKASSVRQCVKGAYGD